MNVEGQIYADDPAKIPADDRARLDGYLRGRVDAEKLAAYERHIRHLEIDREAKLDHMRHLDEARR